MSVLPFLPCVSIFGPSGFNIFYHFFAGGAPLVSLGSQVIISSLFSLVMHVSLVSIVSLAFLGVLVILVRLASLVRLLILVSLV